MTQSNRRTRPETIFSAIFFSPGRVPVRRRGGLALLPFVLEPRDSRPATDASWAWSLRRLARSAVWLLPGYAVVYGCVTMIGPGSTPFLPAGRPLLLLGWVSALWLGLLALMALTSLLVTTRSRRLGTAGLVVSVAGAMALLPLGGLPDGSQLAGTGIWLFAVAGGVLYSLGWLLSGWAVLRSEVLSHLDGGLLMVAAPMLGVGGLLAAALHTLGAVLALAAGIGIAWRAGRLVPVADRAVTSVGENGAVSARVPVAGSPPVPVAGSLAATEPAT